MPVPRALYTLLATASLAYGADEPKADFFEEMGKEKVAETAEVVAIPITKLPDILLPWDKAPAKPFPLLEKITTQVQLDAELIKMRAKYAPFMADIAPELDSRRQKIDLKEFDWRYETPEDKADLKNALDGKGEWKKVKIPHYGGPRNEATAYYRTEIDLTPSMLAQGSLVVHFQGVDYYADAYLNGQHLGSHEGFFDAFEFDLKPSAKPGKNVLLVKVRNTAIQMGDNLDLKNRKYGKKFAAVHSPGWDEPGQGWHMCAPGFGIWQRAWIESRATTSLKDIFVRPLPQNNQAEVWLEVRNPNNDPLELAYSLYGQNFKTTVAENKTEAGESKPLSDGTRLYKFTIPVTGEQLRWWSPEEPWLYQLQVELKQKGKVVDVRKQQFGMRTFEQSETSTPKGRFYLNGKEVRLRGSNMMGNLMQCVVRQDFDQLRDDILLAKICNMNFWRMTQAPCQKEVYDYMDRLGIMTQSDMPIFVGIWREQAGEALRQAGALERLVRNHPSNIIITYINEPIFKFYHGRSTMLPREELLPLFERFDKAVLALNPDQVIKWVDGDLPNISTGYSDHHNFNMWYRGHGIRFSKQYLGAWIPSREGWMYGCGEFGGEGLESIAFMKKHYPKEWTEVAPDGTWSPARIAFNQTERLGPDWFGFTPTTMEEWVEISQTHQTWIMRLATEAMRRDPRMNSFAIAHGIDSWPAGWLKHIMDSDRQAKPAFFAYLDALTPLAVNLRPDRLYAFSNDPVRVGVWICNDTQQIPEGAKLRYQVKLGDKVIRTGETPAKIALCAPEFEGFLNFDAPEVDKRQPMDVQVGLFDASGKLLHDYISAIELFPAADKPAQGQPAPAGAGGHAQRLLES